MSAESGRLGAGRPGSRTPEGAAPAGRSEWLRPLGSLLSLALLAAVLWQLARLDFAGLWRLLPASLPFWLLFVVNYGLGIGFDWLLFRRLWNLPASGITALLRKTVANQFLVDYAGEAYLYAWARRTEGVTPAPFAAIKDVAILSGLAGNAAALLLVALCWPLLDEAKLGAQAGGFALSIAAALAISLVVVLLRGRILSLPARDLRFILLVHLARIATQLLVTALLWLVLLPDINPAWLLLLSTLRQLISRLPLLANKDLPFAAATALLIGPHAALTQAIALIATLSIATHVAVGLALFLGEAAARLAARERG